MVRYLPATGYGDAFSNTQPFTERNSWTILEKLHEATQQLDKSVAVYNQLVTDVNEALAAGKESADAFMADMVVKYNDLLSELLGYTISIDTNEYHAAMMDGSEFTAYTIAGTNKAIDDKMTVFEDTVTTDLTSFKTEVTNQNALFRGDINDSVSTLRQEMVHRHVVTSYGAVGDGMADDTSPIRNAITAAALNGDSVVFPPGNYKITDTITIITPNLQLLGEGGVITAHNMIGKFAFVVNSANVEFHGMKINGLNNLSNGIRAFENIVIDRCDFRNLYHPGGGATRAVWISTENGCRVTNSTFRDINAVGTAARVVGDEDGASRAIVLSMGAVAKAWSVISGNHIQNVIGEEGDAIHVQCNLSGFIKNQSAKTIVSDNMIIDYTKRAIKVQASEVKIVNNHVATALDESFENAGQFTIDIIFGEDCLVQGNTLIGRDKTIAVHMSGSVDSNSYNNIVSGNFIKGGSENYGIISKNNHNVTISDNKIVNCRYPINIVNGSVFLITNNTFTSTIIRTFPIISIAHTAAYVYIDGNVFSGAMDSANYTIDIFAANSTVVNNNDLTLTPLGFIRTNQSGAGMVVNNNRSNGEVFYYHGGDGTYSNMAMGFNHGGTRANKTFFSSSNPTVSMSSMKSNRGDICFNHANGSPSGWRCTETGTPGVWVPFNFAS